MSDEPSIAEAYMAVRALETGLAAAKEELDARLHAQRKALRLKGGFETDLGDVNLKTRDDAIGFTEAGLVDWARANAKHEVIEAWEEVIPATVVQHPASTHASLKKTLTDRCKIVNGEVVDKETGEILTFARVVEGKVWWEARLTQEAKDGVTAAVLDRLPDVLALVASPREIES